MLCRSHSILLLSLILLLGPIAAFGSTNVALISFDLLIPGDINSPGVNVFNIANFTGGFSLPPDFPVLDSLELLNSSLTLMDGGSPLVILLGDLVPGAFNP